MARPRKGWSLRPPRDEHESYAVRFTSSAGRRVERSTGTRDVGEAARRAAEIYARDLTAAPLALARVNPLLALDELFASWLVDLAMTHDEETVETYTGYARRFVASFGNSFARITTATLADYQRMRLTQVLRGTVRKERSALNGFLAWCVEQGVVLETAVPAWPKLPRRTLGVRSGKQRAAPVDVTVEQVRAFLMALPLWSRPIRGVSRPVRARYVVAYETGLRPATLDGLRMPEHWRPGANEIVIADKIDKARFGRTVPLSALAARALESVVEATGLAAGPIFGPHRHRGVVARARREAGLPEGFAPYDLRHGRAGHLLDATGDVRAVMFMLGHKLRTTLDRYVRGNEDRARLMLGAGSGGIVGEDEVSMRGAKEGNRTLTPVKALEPESGDEGRNRSGSADIGVPVGTEKDSLSRGSGGTPETASPDSAALAEHAKYLAVMRAEWEVFDRLAADELLGKGEP